MGIKRLRALGPEQVAVQRDQPLGHRRRGERQDGVARIGAKTQPQRPVVQRAHVPGQRRGVARCTNEACVVAERQLRGARACAGNDRHRARHRLERRIRTWVIECGQHERIRGAVIGSRIGLRPGERYPARKPARASAIRIARKMLVVADDDQMRGCRYQRERVDRRREPFALEARADLQEHHRTLRNPMARTQPCAMRPQLRREDIGRDGVVDDVQDFLAHGKTAPDVVFHHARIADHRAKPGAFEHPPLHRDPIPVMRIDPHAGAAKRPEMAQPLIEPGGVDAIAGAEDVAAEKTLVRLDEIDVGAAERLAHRACEACVAPQSADVKRIDDPRLHAFRTAPRPTARVKRDGDAARDQRRERLLEKSLGAAEGRVALADDGEPQSVGNAPISPGAGAAAPALHARGFVEQRDELPVHGGDVERRQAFGHLAATAAVDAARTAGMHARHDDTLGHHPRPPLVLAGRAEQRERGRPHRRGDVHRRRVDADERARPGGKRRELGQRQLSGEIRDLRARRRRDERAYLVDERALARVRRAGDDEPVSARGDPVEERCAAAPPAGT